MSWIIRADRLMYSTVCFAFFFCWELVGCLNCLGGFIFCWELVKCFNCLGAFFSCWETVGCFNLLATFFSCSKLVERFNLLGVPLFSAKALAHIGVLDTGSPHVFESNFTMSHCTLEMVAFLNQNKSNIQLIIHKNSVLNTTTVYN